MFQKGGYIGFKKKMTHKEKKDWFLDLFLNKSNSATLGKGAGGVVIKLSYNKNKNTEGLFTDNFGLFKPVSNIVALKMIIAHNDEVIKNDVKNVDFAFQNMNDVYGEIDSMNRVAKINAKYRMPITPSVIYYTTITDPKEIEKLLPGVPEKEGRYLFLLFMEYMPNFNEFYTLSFKRPHDKGLLAIKMLNAIYKVLQVQMVTDAGIVHTDFWSRNKGFLNDYNLLKKIPSLTRISQLNDNIIEESFQYFKFDNMPEETTYSGFITKAFEIIDSKLIPMVLDYGWVFKDIEDEQEIMKNIFEKCFNIKMPAELNDDNIKTLPEMLYRQASRNLFKWEDVINFFRWYRLFTRKYSMEDALPYAFAPHYYGSSYGLANTDFGYSDLNTNAAYREYLYIEQSLGKEIAIDKDYILGCPVDTRDNEFIVDFWKTEKNPHYSKMNHYYNTCQFYENIGVWDVKIMNEYLKVRAWNIGVITQIRYYYAKLTKQKLKNETPIQQENTKFNDLNKLNQKINIFYNTGERKNISLKNITVDIVQNHLKDIRMKGLEEWAGKRKSTPSPPSKKSQAYAFVRKPKQENVKPIQGFNNNNNLKYFLV